MKRYIYKLKKGIFFGLGIAIGLGTVALLSVSVSLNTFTPGTPINASQINQNFANLKMAVESVVPVGTVLAYSGTTAPTGFLLCNGNAYPKSSYPVLAALLETTTGSRFGSPDSSTFRVPDLRGRFMRGVNEATGNDPDAGNRYKLYTGGSEGDNIGSYQEDELKSHNHIVPDHEFPGDFGTTFDIGTGNTPTHGDRVTRNTGGSETRPKNVYVNFIIKY